MVTIAPVKIMDRRVPLLFFTYMLGFNSVTLHTTAERGTAKPS